MSLEISSSSTISMQPLQYPEKVTPLEQNFNIKQDRLRGTRKRKSVTDIAISALEDRGQTPVVVKTPCIKKGYQRSDMWSKLEKLKLRVIMEQAPSREKGLIYASSVLGRSKSGCDSQFHIMSSKTILETSELSAGTSWSAKDYIKLCELVLTAKTASEGFHIAAAVLDRTPQGCRELFYKKPKRLPHNLKKLYHQAHQMPNTDLEQFNEKEISVCHTLSKLASDVYKNTSLKSHRKVTYEKVDRPKAGRDALTIFS